MSLGIVSLVVGVVCVLALAAGFMIGRQRSGKGAGGQLSGEPAVEAVAPQKTPGVEIDTAKLERMTEAAFATAVTEATVSFKADIHGSSQRLGELIVRLTTEVVERELEVYRTELAQARDASLKSLHDMQAAIETKQAELETGVDSEMATRKQALMARLDTKLGAAVTAFIVERLGQGVDLGAQRAYLLESLEQHKAELKRDLQDEA